MEKCMRSLPLVLALIPGIALAKAPDWGAEGAGKVEIAGPVEVPLYLGQATKGLPAVWVTGAVPAEGAPTAMFASIDLTRGWTQVPEPVAKALGAKPKGGFAVIPELHIGDVVLRDVRAQVGPAFVIGVATLDELGVAMLPSKGVLKMVPADQAEALLSEVGTAAEAGRNGTKPYFEQGQKVRGNGTSLTVDGTIGGSTGIVYLRPDKAQTQVFSENPTWTRKVDGVRQVGTEPVVAGAKLGSVWAQENGSIGSYDGKMIGSIGFDALYAADVAVAPAAAKIAVKAVDAPKYANPAPKALEQAKAEFQAAEKAAAGAPEEKKPMEGADPGLPGTVGRETAYAGALLAAGQSAEAIEHYRKAVAVAGDACAPYHALGQALLATGNAQEAAPLFEKAGALWDKWYAQDVDTRDLIAAGKAPSLAAPAGKAPSDAAFLLPQASSCHKAWGDAAEAKLAMGDHAGVADLYAKHVDLDADLPLAYGLSLLAQGKAEAADGPIRQAMNLGASDEATRTALALASGGAVADRQVVRVAFSGDLSFGRVGIVEAAR
jgi:tetratricopeptide (TPR) repeat protein